MFLATYKTSMKTLLRDLVLWIAICILIGLLIHRAELVAYVQAIVDDNGALLGHITDKDVSFDMSFKAYVQKVFHLRSNMMLYILPLFTILSVASLLSRDMRDNFFEVQKAGGVSARDYFLGRVTALFTLNALIALIGSFLNFHWYFLSRHGVSFFSAWEYFTDSTVRILRLYALAIIPSLIFFIALPYVLITVTKSSFLGSALSLGYVLFQYEANSILRMRLPQVYHDFMNVIPSNMYMYWGWYDTEWFYEKTRHNPFTPGQLILATGIILSLSTLFFIISYFHTKKREI